MEDPLRRRATGTLGVALNLAVLCYFKYTGFIFDSLNNLTGVSLPFVNIVLPLGISFFTFQQIAYLVDVMRGARVERDIVSYTLFVSFFPHLIAGPLVHHAEMIPQFKRGRTGRSSVLAARGFAIFAAGLFKKVVIADNLAQFVSPVFAHLDAGGGVTTPWAWLATLAYTLADLFRFFRLFRHGGRAWRLLFGIRLPVNFRSPYKADLDHRFLAALAHHAVALPARLSLHSARRQPARRAAPLSQLAGDDAARRALARRRLEFSVWGGLHGIYLSINHLWHSWRGDAARAPAAGALATSLKILSWAVTFFAVVIAWVFFRAKTHGRRLADAGQPVRP